MKKTAILMLTALFFALATTPQLARAAARSTQVIFVNQTSNTLLKVNQDLPHGEWRGEPPASIAPHSWVQWESVSNGFLTGTEGSVRYRLPADAPPQPFPNSETFYMHWNNPYVGSNFYDLALPASRSQDFFISKTGGDGNNTVVTVTLTCRAANLLDSDCDGIPDSWEWYARVVDETGAPVVGATVYASNQPPHTTMQQGLVQLAPLATDQPLVVLSAPQYEQPTRRAAHDGWAYRIYTTNMAWSPDGQFQTFHVSGPGQQRLVLQHTSALILFNLVISIEWDADNAYIQEIADAMRHASSYLYDLTDGQMAFRQVTIYDNAVHWADADIQIAASNTVRPHSFIGGITDSDTGHIIRLGRGWDGTSGEHGDETDVAQGHWNAQDGYRTIAHEFSHYAIALYDAYFGYDLDEHGDFTNEHPAACTQEPLDQSPGADAVNASAMYDQYHSSELAMQGVPGMWSGACETTAQYQLNRNPITGVHESDWETLVRKYADTAQPPRWQLITPHDRNGPFSGPDVERWPNTLRDWPQIILQSTGSAPPPRKLNVMTTVGPAKGVLVALYTLGRRVIGQGFTDSQGGLTVYGSSQDDTLQVASLDGAFAGSLKIGTETELSLTLTPVSGLALQATHPIPHLRIIPNASPDPAQIDLGISLEGFSPDAAPSVLITAPSSEIGYAPLVGYSSSKGVYEGQVDINAAMHGTGRIQVVGDTGGRIVHMQTTYRLQQVDNAHVQDVFADDGNLTLHLNAGSMPGAHTYVVVTPPSTLPGPLPDGQALVGDVYDITASGAIVALDKPALLKLQYDTGIVGQTQLPTEMQIFHWEPNSHTWHAIASRLDTEHQTLRAQVSVLGTYALLAPSLNYHIFMPIAQQSRP